LITTLPEMCFAEHNLGAEFDLSSLNETDTAKLSFAENIGIDFQAKSDVEQILKDSNAAFFAIGKVTDSDTTTSANNQDKFEFSVAQLRDVWFKTSYLLDSKQTKNNKAKERFDNYKIQPLQYVFPSHFSGKKPVLPNGARPKAAVIREKGSNSEREMANAMYLAGFDVKDV